MREWTRIDETYLEQMKHIIEQKVKVNAKKMREIMRVKKQIHVGNCERIGKEYFLSRGLK